VGKSIISANLAVALAREGHRVAVLDSDLYGPSIPSILGIEGGRLHDGPKGIIPPEGPLGIKVVSMAFLLGTDEAVSWLNDLKRGAQELFLANVDYGCLDYLIIDMPPGTGSETVNLFKYLRKITGTIMVTIPSDMAEGVVRRGIVLCQKAEAPIIGIIENMSGLTCPSCGKITMRGYHSGETLAREMEVPLLGKIPRDPIIVNTADKGHSFLLDNPGSDASLNFLNIVSELEAKIGSKGPACLPAANQEQNEGPVMEILEINLGRTCYGESCLRCDKYFECSLPQKNDEFYRERRLRPIKEAMGGIKHKIAVMSCKGGVGKSTISANLAVALARSGKSTAILDCDFHGPCIPKIMGVEGEGLKIGEKGIVPVRGASNVGVISVSFLLQRGEAVTWFDDLKKSTVEQLLNGVDYGNLDYLIIDLPPGTGAESYGLLQYTPDLDGVVIITLPSENPQAVSKRSIALCRQADVPILGVVENMSHFICSQCNHIWRICGNKKPGGVAKETGVPFLGEIPLDEKVFENCDDEGPFVMKYPDSVATQRLLQISRKLREAVELRHDQVLSHDI
jgi:ATP-binding protein involved in chromosome partitioning